MNNLFFWKSGWAHMWIYYEIWFRIVGNPQILYPSQKNKSGKN